MKQEVTSFFEDDEVVIINDEYNCHFKVMSSRNIIQSPLKRWNMYFRDHH